VHYYLGERFPPSERPEPDHLKYEDEMEEWYWYSQWNDKHNVCMVRTAIPPRKDFRFNVNMIIHSSIHSFIHSLAALVYLMLHFLKIEIKYLALILNFLFLILI
jgi:hypothetical protein